MVQSITGKIIEIKHYSEEKYSVIFNKQTGFFARIEDDNCEEPFWSQHGPELLDISITNWCDKSCEFCYRKSHKNGISISISDYRKIMKQATEVDVFQVALGGGNTNQHVRFNEILQMTREEFGIIPSYTTNGLGVSTSILKATRDYCGSVALSYYQPLEFFISTIERFIGAGIKTNIHFLLDNRSINKAIELLEYNPSYFKNINAIIFLNYKPVNNPKYNRLLKLSNRLKYFYSLISKNKYPFKIGFDSCSISGIVSYLNINNKFIEPCESARFSAFVSEDMKMFPCSFMCHTNLYGDLRKFSMKDIWLNNLHFQNFRSTLKNPNCINCHVKNLCLGGCNFLKEVNLCKH